MLQPKQDDHESYFFFMLRSVLLTILASKTIGIASMIVCRTESSESQLKLPIISFKSSSNAEMVLPLSSLMDALTDFVVEFVELHLGQAPCLYFMLLHPVNTQTQTIRGVVWISICDLTEQKGHKVLEIIALFHCLVTMQNTQNVYTHVVYSTFFNVCFYI